MIHYFTNDTLMYIPQSSGCALFQPLAETSKISASHLGFSLLNQKLPLAILALSMFRPHV